MNSNSSNHADYTEVELKNLLVDHNSSNNNRNKLIKAKNNNVNLTVREDVEYIEDISETKKVDSSVLADNSREQWGNYMEYLLSIIGFVIDLGNVWRY